MGFRDFNNYPFFAANAVVDDAEVWLGAETRVPLVIEDEVLLTMSRKTRRDITVTVAYESPISAPIVRGARLAELRIEGPNMEPVVRDLVAGVAVDRLGFVGRLGTAISHIVWGTQSP